MTAGQVVATLDTDVAPDGRGRRPGDLASAQATLASDETAQTDGADDDLDGTSTARPAAGTGRRPPTTGVDRRLGRLAASSAEVAKLQATLVADQHKQDAGRRRRRGGAGRGHDGLHDVDLATAGRDPRRGRVGHVVRGQCRRVGGTAGTGGAAGGGPAAVAPAAAARAAPQTCTQALAAASSAHQALVAAIDQVTKDEAALAAALGLGSSGGTGGRAVAPADGLSGGGSTTVHRHRVDTSRRHHDGRPRPRHRRTDHAASAYLDVGAPRPASSASGGHAQTVTARADRPRPGERRRGPGRTRHRPAERRRRQPGQHHRRDGGLGRPDGRPVGVRRVAVGHPAGRRGRLRVTTTRWRPPCRSPRSRDVARGPAGAGDPGLELRRVLTGTVTGIGVLGTRPRPRRRPTRSPSPSSRPASGPSRGRTPPCRSSPAGPTGVTTVPTSAVRTVGTTH